MNDHEFKFTGNAKEYFGIWIVNLLLSIVTIGIYTAWAKVRRVRYFYANTWLDEHNFEYHARPVSILIGRIIVVGALLAYNVLINLTPLAALVLVPYMIILPWIINKAIRFNARVTSYRNIRFNFAGTYWRAFLVFVIMPMVAIISLGILGPVASRLGQNYIGNNLKYGTAKFSTDAPLGKLYSNWGASIGFFVVATLGLGIISAIVMAVDTELGFIEQLIDNPGIKQEFMQIYAMSITGIIVVYIAAIFSYLFYRAGVRNVAYNATVLEGGHRLVSTLARGKYVWILITNLLAALATIGLLRPWAAIRSWRYLADNTSLKAASDLTEFVEQKTPEGTAAGAEFLDIEGIDFGL